MSRDSESCLGATYHSPVPLWTARHHIYPTYLCSLLSVAKRNELVPLCDTEHVNVHHALHHLISGGTQGGHSFSSRTQGYIDLAWGWWQAVLLSGSGA